MLAQVWLAPMAEPEWADGILHQSLGEIIAALLASGLLLPVTLFLLVLLVAHLSRDYGKPVRRRISDPPLCSAYRDHPPANCVDDPPVSLAVRLRLPLRIALWVAGIALVLTIVWQANLLITGSWSPTVIFDAGLYESKLRDQCQIAHNWLLDNSFEIDRLGG